MLKNLTDQLLEMKMKRQAVSDLPSGEEKVANGMMKKGYRFIITKGSGTPKYAKSMRLATELAGELGKGAMVAVLEDDDCSEIEHDLAELAQSIAEFAESEEESLELDEPDDEPESIEEATAVKLKQLEMMLKLLPRMPKAQQRVFYKQLKGMDDGGDKKAKTVLLKQMKAIIGDKADEESK